ncbi:MAG: hypothetical protein WAO08_03560 [Hyphomicrobiaceae bacterium]
MALGGAEKRAPAVVGLIDERTGKKRLGTSSLGSLAGASAGVASRPTLAIAAPAVPFARGVVVFRPRPLGRSSQLGRGRGLADRVSGWPALAGERGICYARHRLVRCNIGAASLA